MPDLLVSFQAGKQRAVWAQTGCTSRTTRPANLQHHAAQAFLAALDYHTQEPCLVVEAYSAGVGCKDGIWEQLLCICYERLREGRSWQNRCRPSIARAGHKHQLALSLQPNIFYVRGSSYSLQGTSTFRNVCLAIYAYRCSIALRKYGALDSISPGRQSCQEAACACIYEFVGAHCNSLKFANEVRKRSEAGLHCCIVSRGCIAGK